MKNDNNGIADVIIVANIPNTFIVLRIYLKIILNSGLFKSEIPFFDLKGKTTNINQLIFCIKVLPNSPDT